MPDDLPTSAPRAFGLSSFAELLAPRDPVLGEDPGTYEAVHAGLMATLSPLSPYECLIAENLISIEWELVQHRKLRDDLHRREVMSKVFEALVGIKREEHEWQNDQDWKEHVKRGGTEDDWDGEPEFDLSSAEEFAGDLVDRATSIHMSERFQAWAEMQELDANFTEISSAAYFPKNYQLKDQLAKHDASIAALEKRRREVMRDYETLQRVRPIEEQVVVS